MAPPTLCYWTDPALAADVSAANNDSIAAVVRGQPDRFVGLCTVPLQDVDRSIRELERAMRMPEFRGVMIANHLGERNLDHPEMVRFLEACQEVDACVFVHPYDVLGSERLQRYYMWNLIGMVTETAVAIESLMFGGVYERLPRLKTYFAHAGGSFPWLRGRAEHGFFNLKTAKFDVDKPPSAYLDRVLDHRLAVERLAPAPRVLTDAGDALPDVAQPFPLPFVLGHSGTASRRRRSAVGDGRRIWTTSTRRPSASSRSRISSLRSSAVRPGSNSTRKSTSLSGRARF